MTQAQWASLKDKDDYEKKVAEIITPSLPPLKDLPGDPEIYYDYDLQVWVVDGVIEDCNHPDDMKYTTQGSWCCNSYRYAGMKIEDVEGGTKA